MLLTSRADLLMRRPGVAYPFEYATDAAWFDAIVHMRQPELRQVLEHHLAEGTLGTSLSQRYAVVKFLDTALGHVIGLQPARADMGCGNNDGNARIVLSDVDERFRFDEIAVLGGHSVSTPAVSSEKSSLLNACVARLGATLIIGVDREPDNEEVHHWRLAGLTPEEHARGKVVELHDALARARIDPRRLTFRQADVTVPAEVDTLLEAHGGQFDVVSAVASVYIGTAAERRAKLAGMRRLRKPRGVTYVIDFVRRASSPGTLRTLGRWSRMNVYLSRGDEEFTRVMAATNGRWREAHMFKELTQFTDGGPLEQEVRQLVA